MQPFQSNFRRVKCVSKLWRFMSSMVRAQAGAIRDAENAQQQSAAALADLEAAQSERAAILAELERLRRDFAMIVICTSDSIRSMGLQHHQARTVVYFSVDAELYLLRECLNFCMFRCVLRASCARRIWRVMRRIECGAGLFCAFLICSAAA